MDEDSLTSGKVAPAVRQSIESVTVDPRDAGAVALAGEYARLLDEPATATKYARALAELRRVVRAAGDPRSDEALETVTMALAAHTVASDLGPKLLAVLTALGLTPVGRGAVKGVGQGGVTTDPAENEIARQIAKRIERQNRATTLDTSSS